MTALRTHPPSRWLMLMPALIMWSGTLVASYVLLNHIVELIGNNREISNIHPSAKELIRQHLLGLSILVGTSFLAGCFWLTRNIKTAYTFTAASSILFVGVLWNFLKCLSLLN